MSTGWIIICSAAAGTATCGLIADAVFGRAKRVNRRIESASARGGTKPAIAQSLFRNWSPLSGPSTGLAARSRLFVEQSGISIGPLQLAAAAGLFAGTCGVLGAALAPHPLWGLPALAAGILLPVLFVWSRRRKRTERIRRQLPEAFDAMSRAVQAGQTLQSAMQLVANDGRPPLSAELRRCCEQQNLGLSPEATLRDLADRIPVVELRIFIIVLLVQRQCGGSPVDVLSNMSDLVRKRMRLLQRVRALTGEGRMQAFVLTTLPVSAFAWLLLTRPDYVQPLLERPQLMGGIVAMQVAGAAWIHRIVRIDY